MSPSLIIALMMVAGTAGGLFYSYHVGRAQGENICNEEKLQAQLNKTQTELNNQIELSQFQQEQIGEAQSQLEQGIIRNEELKQALDIATRGQFKCISNSVLDELRKFRRNTKDKNS